MIPKIIHRLVPKRKNDWHPLWLKCEQSWFENFPDDQYEYIYWDDDKIENFIEEKFEDLYLPFKAFPHEIMRIDFARYCILQEYGGIYVDMDYFCYENFYNDLKGDFSIVESPSPYETVQNSLMSSTGKCDFLTKLIDLCIHNYNKYELIRSYKDDKYGTYISVTCGNTTIGQLIDSLTEDEKSRIQILNHIKYNPPVYEWNPNMKEDKNTKCMHFMTGHWGKETHVHHYQISNSLKISYEQQLKRSYKFLRNIEVDDV